MLLQVNMVLDNHINTCFHLCELTDVDVPPLQPDAFMQEAQEPEAPTSVSRKSTLPSCDLTVLIEPPAAGSDEASVAGHTTLESPFVLPHTVASRQRAIRAGQHKFSGSAANLKLKPSERVVVEPQEAPIREEAAPQPRRYHSKSLPFGPELAALNVQQPSISPAISIKTPPKHRTMSETASPPTPLTFPFPPRVRTMLFLNFE